MSRIYAPAPAACSACGFSTPDLFLLAGHSCDVQSFGGRCEDYPCCGHEAGDCNGLLYGSDEAIKAEVYAHIYCDHEAGHYACESDDYYERDVDPEDCDHDDTSFNTTDDGLTMVNRSCDICYADLPDAPVPAEWLD